MAAEGIRHMEVLYMQLAIIYTVYVSFQTEAVKWTKILKRIIDVVL